MAFLDGNGITTLIQQLKPKIKTYLQPYFQEPLISGENIKTINNISLLGSENISVATSAQGTKADNAMPISGGTFTGAVTLNADPTTNLQAATKQYVDNNKITVDSALSSISENPVQNKVINTALGNKVDVVTGKGLSTNDYTTAEKTKLGKALTTDDKGVANGVATLNASSKVDNTYLNIDNALSTTSENPVQNKVINTALSNKVDNVSYDTTNKKLTKTINGTTTDIVTVSTLKTDMQIPDIIAITNAEIDTVTGIIPDNVYQAMADSY